MQSLKIPLTEQKKEKIGSELERLFMLQDRNLGETKRNFLIQELDREGFPFDAILNGIRILADADLRMIKFFTIKEAVRKFLVFENRVGDCGFCRGAGRVSMVKGGYSFAFACKCSDGIKWGKEYPRWDGNMSQTINSGKYELADYLFLGSGFTNWVRTHGTKGDRPKDVPEALNKVVGVEYESRKESMEWQD